MGSRHRQQRLSNSGINSNVVGSSNVDGGYYGASETKGHSNGLDETNANLSVTSQGRLRKQDPPLAADWNWAAMDALRGASPHPSAAALRNQQQYQQYQQQQQQQQQYHQQQQQQQQHRHHQQGRSPLRDDPLAIGFTEDDDESSTDGVIQSKTKNNTSIQHTFYNHAVGSQASSTDPPVLESDGDNDNQMGGPGQSDGTNEPTEGNKRTKKRKMGGNKQSGSNRSHPLGGWVTSGLGGKSSGAVYDYYNQARYHHGPSASLQPKLEDSGVGVGVPMDSPSEQYIAVPSYADKGYLKAAAMQRRYGGHGQGQGQGLGYGAAVDLGHGIGMGGGMGISPMALGGVLKGGQLGDNINFDEVSGGHINRKRAGGAGSNVPRGGDVSLNDKFQRTWYNLSKQKTNIADAVGPNLHALELLRAKMLTQAHVIDEKKLHPDNIVHETEGPNGMSLRRGVSLVVEGAGMGITPSGPPGAYAGNNTLVMNHMLSKSSPTEL